MQAIFFFIIFFLFYQSWWLDVTFKKTFGSKFKVIHYKVNNDFKSHTNFKMIKKNLKKKRTKKIGL
jgi:hypothetical protein